MQKKVQAKFIISGLVQGVGFRYFVYQKAIELDLKGFAKNLYDGTVETIAEGDQATIDLLHNLLKIGPSRSHVDSVVVEYSDFSGEFSQFEIR